MSTTRVQLIDDPWKGRSLLVWLSIIVFLFLLLYGPILKALFIQWWNDPDYSHGFFVPLFSGYVLWRQRERWLTTESKPNDFGLLVMIGAIGLLLNGWLAAELFVSRSSMVFLLGGMTLFLLGRETLRAISFPLGFLFLMIPIPSIIYSEITFPLQLFASRLASSVLEMVGVPVLRDGNILILSNYSLEVVEACSGIRSLMSLVALAVAYGYLAEPRWAIRCILVVSMVPIAILTNALRITGTGLMAHQWGPTVAEGFLHECSGLVIFFIALFLMFVLHRIFNMVWKISGEASRA